MNSLKIRMAAKLWRDGKGTLEIANYLAVKESVIYNYIEIIRAEARRDNGR
jgi:DNA-binding CsgD family transcriptional regulator